MVVWLLWWCGCCGGVVVVVVLVVVEMSFSYYSKDGHGVRCQNGHHQPPPLTTFNH